MNLKLSTGVAIALSFCYKMKAIYAALALIISASFVNAGEVILPYSAFGPQVAAYELIGKEWWQWDTQGDDKDKSYPIKVVVYWDQTEAETARRHPVDQTKLQDYRYVEFSKAVAHLEKTIRECRSMKLDATAIEDTLALLKKQKAEQVAGGNGR